MFIFCKHHVLPCLCARDREHLSSAASSSSHTRKKMPNRHSSRYRQPSRAQCFFLYTHTPCTGRRGLSTIKLLKLASYTPSCCLFFCVITNEKVSQTQMATFFPRGSTSCTRSRTDFHPQQRSGRKQTRERTHNTLC
jgi:hypothetical protein